jgi:hypothetical protein
MAQLISIKFIQLYGSVKKDLQATMKNLGGCLQEKSKYTL